uniref:HIT domain-containing protein n=1 Tax=Heliothis virescens TaxID=7102 RepID=A0A2A4J3D9_HELVI
MSKRRATIASVNMHSKKSNHWSLGLVESMKDPECIVKKTKQAVVIKDKYPKAKIHYLVLPNEDINSIYKLDKSHIGLLEEFGDVFNEIQNEEELPVKAGFHAVPSMQRLHMHIISTDMVSPSLKTKMHWNSFTTEFFKPYADVLEELKKNGCINKMSPELHKSLMATELKCNQCTFKPKNMPELKEHLLKHIMN